VGFAEDRCSVWTETAFSVDVTAMLAEAMRRGISFAFLLQGANVTSVSTRFGTNPARVVIAKADGSEELLELLFAGSASIASPAQSNAIMALPAFYEFAKPAEVPTKAVLHFHATVGNQYSKTDAAIYLLNPDKSLPVPRTGGVDGGELDAAIAAVPSIIGAHRYLDAEPEDAYIFHDPRPSHARNIGAEQNYSPELFGGPVDTSKYPYVGAGKWLNPTPARLWSRAWNPHGPLAPGGALRVEIAKTQAVEGARGLRRVRRGPPGDAAASRQTGPVRSPVRAAILLLVAH
jgi:hypothetical protein